jgi:ATP-dependent RNA helicase MSS116
MNYSSMKGRLHDGLLKGLEVMGYETMSPVQQKTLNEMPNFRADVLAQAKTGTGKTIAFLLPALHSLLTQSSLRKGQVGILILSPTRELALQIAKECDALTAQLQNRPECHTAYGGTSKATEQRKFLNGDPKILVATPGRLNDYLSDEYVAERFQNVQTLVLDEADTMLESGFLVAINDILRRLPPKSKGWQGMCFSATVPPKVKDVLSKVLKSNYTHLTTVDPNETPTIELVTQHSVVIPSVAQTYSTLYAILMKEYETSPKEFKAIVFGTTANGVALMHALFSRLLGNQMSVFQLQSRLSQNARTRTTNEFKAASAGLMFASDVIGRGMDFPNVSLVVQVGIPSNGEQYVHRVGRTARAGNEGRAVILLTQRESFFLKINRQLPITPYPHNISSTADAAAGSVVSAFDSVDEATRTKAYQAWLGFHKVFTKQLQLNNEGLVAAANEYAESMGMPEPPLLDKQVVGKMGLRGVPGLNVGHVERTGGRGGRGGGGGGGGRGGRSNGPSGGRDTNGDAPSGRGRGGGRGGRGGRGGGRGRGGVEKR